MAKLISEESDCGSVLELTGGEIQLLPEGDKEQSGESQTWQKVHIRLMSGQRTASTLPDEDVMVCRKPTDEVAELVRNLRLFAEKQRPEVLFEPSEPSFEISLARSPRDGIKVEAWLDAGNGLTGFYTWDACGIRFYTTHEHLLSFISQLEQEFGVASAT